MVVGLASLVHTLQAASPFIRFAFCILHFDFLSGSLSARCRSL
jgi:hypothetical protein